ncbi:hypothetical protein Ciccas_005461 [Cichlidogyrus casuarinus]|uniref:WW domain-containing protein n=1 Tax=Cichlidogyrus casuarinus TaxID=1844966 RepID=A0ABD2Q9J9_9PLAT
MTYEATGTTSSSSSQIPFPALHLHLSDDGSSPLPPGWDRAPNPTASSNSVAAEGASSNNYPHYYYHVKTRLTRWDPPVYPWDADPETQKNLPSDWSNENLVPDSENYEDFDPLKQTFAPTPEHKKDEPQDPESPYDWGLASRYQVTHEDIDLLYSRIRVQMLEKQCQEMIHEIAHHSDCPKGASEHSYAIEVSRKWNRKQIDRNDYYEIYSLVHNTLREFRDARCTVGRITNDEDLHALTRKLAQEITLKEVQKLRQATSEQRAKLLNIPEGSKGLPFDSKGQLIPGLREKIQSYIRKYMIAKGPVFKGSGATSTGVKNHHHHHHHHPKPPPPPAPNIASGLIPSRSGIQ